MYMRSHTLRLAFRRCTIIAFIALAVIGITRLSHLRAQATGGQSDSLAAIAAKAKAAGEQTATVTLILHEGGSRESLKETVETLSALVVEARHLNRGVAKTEHLIYTWHILRVAEVISARPPIPMLCEGPSPAFPVAQGDAALAVPGGTEVIDGVRVTMKTKAAPQLKNGGRYLLLASQCPGNVVVPPEGVNNFFEIDSENRIVVRSDQPVPFASELAKLGTVQALRQYLLHEN